MLQNGGGNDWQDRQRRKVERWETLEVLYDRQESTRKARIGFSIEVKQPVFEDGSRGFPKLGVKLERDDRFLRFVCFDGDVSELQALYSLICRAENIGFEKFQAAYDGHMATYRSAARRGFSGDEGVSEGARRGAARFGDGNDDNGFERRRTRRHGKDDFRS